MSKYFVRASILLTILLLVHQIERVNGGDRSCNCGHGSGSYANLPVPEASETMVGVQAGIGVQAGYPAAPQGHWQPGGYEGRIGSPYYYQESPTYGMMSSSPDGYDQGYAAYGHGGHAGYALQSNDPYTAHFGPGYYRNHEHGHYRFPYYSYRRPWYYPGHPVYNRDTNFAW